MTLWIGVVTLLIASAALAQPVETKILASDGSAGQQFGGSVDLSGDVAIVGAYADETFGTRSGAAYVYRFDGSEWTDEVKLLPPLGSPDHQFGISVAIDGDLAVVGARGDDENGSEAGAVYVFRFNGLGWFPETKLLASDGDLIDQFGSTVAVSGNRIAVGAPLAQGRAEAAGAVYVFEYNGSEWVEEAKLTTSDGEYGDAMHIVDIDGDTVVTGVFLDDDAGFSSGSAYVFRFDGMQWVEEAKLVASDATAISLFGSAVSVSGDIVAVGSNFQGAAYVFRYDGTSWTEEARLSVTDSDLPADRFGSAVSLSGPRLLVGAPGIDGNEQNSGAAYLFRFDGTTWVEQIELLASDGGEADLFGISRVGLSGNSALVGARNHDDNGEDSGAVYVFSPLVEPIEVAIDIKPGSDVNPIRPTSHGVIPVAILGSTTFDVADVDVTTLAFGPAGASPAHAQGGHFADVDGDGFRDLLSHYRSLEARITLGDTEACVTGETLDGAPVMGCDTIRTTIGCGIGFELVFLVAGLGWLRPRRGVSPRRAGRGSPAVH